MACAFGSTQDACPDFQGQPINRDCGPARRKMPGAEQESFPQRQLDLSRTQQPLDAFLKRFAGFAARLRQRDA